jgi:hypothetical protein
LMECYKVKMAEDEEKACAWLETMRGEGYCLVKKYPLVTSHHDSRGTPLASSKVVLYLLVERLEALTDTGQDNQCREER